MKAGFEVTGLAVYPVKSMKGIALDKAVLTPQGLEHDRRFMVPAADPAPAWRRLPRGGRLERVCCFKYRRTVARDGSVRAGATILQLPPKPDGRSRAGQRVELHVRLDGRLVVWDGQRELVTTPAPLDAVQLRALAHARVELGERPRRAATATIHTPDHPGAGSRRAPSSTRGSRQSETG